MSVHTLNDMALSMYQMLKTPEKRQTSILLLSCHPKAVVYECAQLPDVQIQWIKVQSTWEEC